MSFRQEEEELDHSLEWHSLEAVLGVEVALWIDRGVVNASNNPWWAIERPNNTFCRLRDSGGVIVWRKGTITPQ